MLTHGSLFSGIGGFDLGFDRAGIPARWQCEIDPAAREVLDRHWPDVPCHRDVSVLDGADLEPVDVVTFGSPCQDLSVSGRRAGLDGDRSNLFFEACRIVKEMRDATVGVAPRWVVWENVPGAFSSNAGRDFGAVLDALADLGALDVAWRTLDARWFGVPQRRRRVFVVADFGGESAAEILAVGEGVLGHPRPRIEEGTVVAPLVASGVGGGGGPDASDAIAGHLIPCLTDPARLDDQSVGQLIPFAVQPETGQGSDLTAVEVDVAPTITAPEAKRHDRGVRIVFDRAQVTHPTNRSNAQPGGPAPTLPATGSLHVAGVPDIAGTLGSKTGGSRSTDLDGHGAYIPETAWNAVRRLTPTECERLQGFPDGWTGPAGADTPRYRTLGNAVCVNVAEWIARNLDRVAGKGTEG